MKRIKLLLSTAAIGVSILFIFATYAFGSSTERIISFHSEIKIHEDSSMTVTETIKVNCTGNQIKRGIYRDFPTRYKDRFGHNYVVDFDVIEVLRDGLPESYHFQNLSNGKRLYIGRRDFYLSAGIYTYTLVYKTNRQLGFFKDFDELYWNVTGNGWSFSIDKASATVELPEAVSGKLISVDGYTGFMGSKDKDYSAETDIFGRITFMATRPLMPREGLTIVVSWPKGYVAEPTILIKLGYLFRDNLSVFVGLLGLAILLAYYLSVWDRFGRDPAKGTIIPLYNPPEKISPAAARYILRMGFDNKVFSSAVINMAVKGFLTIREEYGIYCLKKTDEVSMPLSKEEMLIADNLFGARGDVLYLEQRNHVKIRPAIAECRRSLANRFEAAYFLRNIKYFMPGIIISVLVTVVTALLQAGEKMPIVLFMSVWLTLWSFAVVALLKQVKGIWQAHLTSGKGISLSLGRVFFMSVFALPFIAIEIIGIGVLTFSTSFSVIIILLFLVGINILFYHLLKAPTLAGRKIMDELEGFIMYLSVAEKERLNLLNPPQKTPELFEKYLPYALALDVEQAWSEQFSEILERSAQTGEVYAPAWYSGSSWRSFGATDFASNISGSLTSAISSSSVAPGSSSGGGGGGGSGGGGGGGGGGGW